MKIGSQNHQLYSMICLKVIEKVSCMFHFKLRKIQSNYMNIATPVQFHSSQRITGSLSEVSRLIPQKFMSQHGGC